MVVATTAHVDPSDVVRSDGDRRTQRHLGGGGDMGWVPSSWPPSVRSGVRNQVSRTRPSAAYVARPTP